MQFTAGSGMDAGFGYGSASASSAFGNLLGSVTVSGSPDYLSRPFPSVEGQFSASFSDPVLVIGYTGFGTLVAHFSWTGSVSAGPHCTPMCFPDSFFPSFTAGAGATVESWNTSASVYSGTLDIASPFSFGGLTTISGSLAAQVNNSLSLSQYSQGAGAGANATLVLTGFSIYDEAGVLVPTAQAVVTPEPGTLGLILGSVLLLAGMMNGARRRAA